MGLAVGDRALVLGTDRVVEVQKITRQYFGALAKDCIVKDADGRKFLNYRCDACRGKGEYKATIQARKPHICRHCGQQIDVGTEYVRITTGPWYDESIKAVESTAYHPVCWTEAIKIPYLIIPEGADE